MKPKHNYRNDTRNRKYQLTINNPENHNVTHESIKQALEKYHLKYLAMCDETGQEGTYHIHVFIYFDNAIYFSSVKKIFPTANILTALGTSQQNRSYLLKALPEHNKDKNGYYDYTDAGGKQHKGQNHTDTFEEIGECPLDQQGKRNDLAFMYSLVKDGYSDSEILEKCPETAIKHIDKIAKLRLTYLSDKFRRHRRLDLKVNYITGKTGTGKSRDILDEYGDENVYRVTDYQHPFDSYQPNMSCICFEEFRSSLKMSDMLNYLDIYPLILPARYTSKVACYSTVFVVSNWDFESQYSELQKIPEQRSSYEAFIRRFNGFVKVYTDSGIVTYPTIQAYLNRNLPFAPVDEPTPFDETETDET